MRRRIEEHCEEERRMSMARKSGARRSTRSMARRKKRRSIARRSRSSQGG